ncbi:MAG: tRNA dihydrouridine synthase DusB [Candidatus Cloacimonetes bacterium]|nr:tRNA dihydrouridine synthase DusB [Candidatus Cloacimonadota bacterium]
MQSIIEKLTDHKIWLAPLAGITDRSFRSICKECGADVVVSEMVSVDGLLYNKERSLEYARFDQSQRPFGLQLFGSNPEIFLKALDVALSIEPDFIDINMGCPVKKVVKRGAGSSMMTTPDIAAEIVSKVKNKLQPKEVPLSVKFRAGWDNSSVNAIEFGIKMQNAGADVLCLHPRTRSQMYSGKSNWTLLKELKQKVSVPVVGNGDVKTIQDVLQMYDETRCDSIMIGRGVIGKPWFFTKIKNFMTNNDESEPTTEEKLKIIQKHLNLTINDKGKQQALLEMRTHFSHYTKGFQGGAKVRASINKSEDVNEIVTLIKELYRNKLSIG